MDTKQEKKKGITMGKAILKLQMGIEGSLVTVHVLKARHLSSSCSPEPCQSYVEVSLDPDVTRMSRCRTHTRADRHPIFNEKFSFELVMPDDYKKRLYISVWNAYPANTPGNTRSLATPQPRAAPFGQLQLEFMGCMSFGIHHVLAENKAVDGWYYLLKDGIGRRKHLQAILNSVIYSDAGEVKQWSGNATKGEQGNHPAAPRGQAIINNTVYAQPHIDPCQRVSQTCQQIVSDLTSERCRNVDQENNEEDTYTTFVFTKAPISSHRYQNGVIPQSEYASVINGDCNAADTQCTRAQQEESIYVKMYPPKSWRPNGCLQNSSQKPVKHVGFSDLVNSNNVRGLPDSRRQQNKHPYHSASLVDISEVDTNGYMSLSQVRRQADDDSVYASIEPLNGSYMNDNVSEISEFTYSKSLSRASQQLYPFLQKTPLPNRKLLNPHPGPVVQPRGQPHAQTLPAKQQLQRMPPPLPQNTQINMKSVDKRKQIEIIRNDVIPSAPHVPNKNGLLLKPPVNTRVGLYTADGLNSPNSDQFWMDNNVHNDSGICDNDSSPKSDGEFSDTNMAFTYNHQKQNGVAQTSHAALLRTPTAQRRSMDMLDVKSTQNTPKVLRKVPLTPQVPRRKVSQHLSQSNGNLKIADSPRYPRGQTNVECTNDSCVEDNVSGNKNTAHTPSCPYHVCTNCNGLVPHHDKPCSDQHCDHKAHTNGHIHNPKTLHADPMAHNGVGYNEGTHSEGIYSEGMYSEGIYSEGMYSEDQDSDGDDEDDFGYMTMEKFNIYKDTVLKHHKEAVQCTDHETTTKIYFL